MIRIFYYPVLKIAGSAIQNAHVRCTHVGDVKREYKPVVVGKAGPENVLLFIYLNSNLQGVQLPHCGLFQYPGNKLTQHGSGGCPSADDCKIEVHDIQRL